MAPQQLPHKRSDVAFCLKLHHRNNSTLRLPALVSVKTAAKQYYFIRSGVSHGFSESAYPRQATQVVTFYIVH